MGKISELYEVERKDIEKTASTNKIIVAILAILLIMNIVSILKIF